VIENLSSERFLRHFFLKKVAKIFEKVMSYEKLSDYDFNLPDELIATHPAEPRDSSRLLVLDKKTGKIEHKYFYNIIDYLRAGDILVLNNSKVIPARLMARKRQSPEAEILPGHLGGKVEVLLHKKLDKNIWQCLVGGKVKEDLILSFLTLPQPSPCEEEGVARVPSPFQGEGQDEVKLSAKVLKNNHDGTWDLQFNKSGAALMKTIEKIGEVPLPPYIVKQRKKEKTLPVSRGANHPSSPFAKATGDKQEGIDSSDYQTVFADDKKAGSVAAPTAGLHFTPELLQKIKNKGVKILEITLYVGMGTFAPVKTEDITKHVIHSELVEIESEVIMEIKKNREQRTKNKSGRIIAVGTTSARSLEACFFNLTPALSLVRRGGFKEWVDIFIYPGYKFKIVDAMITNFHLPKSTLLMLVSALAGKKNIDKAYREAIKKKYKFYSYGDAMFIK
jgi:S-adenosylmethionine:tRNA ribosyltransferase-isomerase